MGAKQQSSDQRRYFKLIAKAEKAESGGKRAICEIVKNGDKYEQGSWFSGLTGFIVSAEVKEFIFENETKKKCVVVLQDSSEICQLEFTLNFATFGLINALLNADISRELEISAWIGKTGYVGAGVKYLGDQDSIQWKVAMDDQPKGEKYTVPGKTEPQTSYANVAAFWEMKFLEVASAIKTHGRGIQPIDHEKQQYQAAPQLTGEQPDLEDLPF